MGGNAPKPKSWRILGFSECLLICACSRSFKESSGSIPREEEYFLAERGKTLTRFGLRATPGIGGGGVFFTPEGSQAVSLSKARL